MQQFCHPCKLNTLSIWFWPFIGLGGLIILSAPSKTSAAKHQQELLSSISCSLTLRITSGAVIIINQIKYFISMEEVKTADYTLLNKSDKMPSWPLQIMMQVFVLLEKPLGWSATTLHEIPPSLAGRSPAAVPMDTAAGDKNGKRPHGNWKTKTREKWRTVKRRWWEAHAVAQTCICLLLGLYHCMFRFSSAFFFTADRIVSMWAWWCIITAACVGLCCHSQHRTLTALDAHTVPNDSKQNAKTQQSVGLCWQKERSDDFYCTMVFNTIKMTRFTSITQL